MQSKAVLAIAVGLLFLIIALGFYNIKISSASIKHEIQDSNTVAASASAEFIKRDLDNLLERTELMLAHSDLIDAVTNRDTVRTQKILSQFVKTGAHVDRAFITNPEGILWSVYPYEKGRLGHDYAHREWFEGVKATGQPFISDVYRRPDLPNQEVITIARYIRNGSGEVIGFLCLHYRLYAIDKLIESIATKSEGEKIVLLDSAGAIAAPFTPNRAPNRKTFKNLEPFKQALSGKEWVGEFIDPVDDRESIGTFVPIHLNGGNKTWVVVSSRREAGAFAPARRNQMHLAITSLLLFLATAAGSFAVIQSNRRVDKLNVELDKNNRDLELRVAARTEELITIINASPNYVFYKDCDDNIVRINEPAAKSIGKTRKEVEGRPSKEFYPDEAEEYRKADMQVIKSGEPLLNIVETYRLGTGEKRWVRTDKIPYRDEFGDIIGVIVFALDVTDLKSHEEELKQLAAKEHEARLESDRLSFVKDEFLITLSHELRTPLVPILGWLELIEKSSMSKEALKKALGVIERNARAELALVEELLDNSRIISGKMLIDSNPVALLRLISATVESSRLAAEAKNIELKMEIIGNPGFIFGDVKRLGQVFWNLLSNSVKFTPPKGKITVRISSSDSTAIIEVIDNGNGIDPRFLPHVFDRFHQADSSTTRNFGGLGLGLSLAKHLAEAHGGTLKASSPGVGLGATFTVELPNNSLPEGMEAYSLPYSGLDNTIGDPAEGFDQMLSHLKILIVDDNPDDRILMHAFLSGQGAEVVTASSVEEGMDLINICRPDLLLSDIGMPGEDGISFIRKVRRMTTIAGSIPAIALTAYGQPEDKLKATNAGYNLHITKPINSSKLAQLIRELVTRKHTDQLNIRPT